MSRPSDTPSTITRSFIASDASILTSVGDWSIVENSKDEYTSLSTTRGGASAQFNFIGTSIRVKGTIPNLTKGSLGPIGLYYIDGILDTTYHYIRHEETNYNYTFFESQYLSPEQHTLLITSDVDSAIFTLDYIDISVPIFLASETLTGVNSYPTRASTTTSDSWTRTRTRDIESPTSASIPGLELPSPGRVAINSLVRILVIVGVGLVLCVIGGAVYYFCYWPWRKRRINGRSNGTTNVGNNVQYAPVPAASQSTSHLPSPQPYPNTAPLETFGTGEHMTEIPLARRNVTPLNPFSAAPSMEQLPTSPELRDTDIQVVPREPYSRTQMPTT